MPLGGTMPGTGGSVHYIPSTTDPINIDLSKIECEEFGWFEIEITNSVGLTTVCDPVDVTLLRANGRPERHSFTLNDREGNLFINNHGLREIFMDLNGHKLHFSLNGTGNNAFIMEERGPSSFDIFEFLKPGDNELEIRAVGPPRGSARIFIHD